MPGRYPAGVSARGGEHALGDAERGGLSSTDVAKDQAGQVADTARDAGKCVAGVAGEQAGNVASEATHQVKDLVAQTRSELTAQAATQQQCVANGLRSLSRELDAMARGSQNPGMATDLVGQVSERTRTVASWLEDREPGHVLDEVTPLRPPTPGTFLALAAGAGLLVGRLGRGLKAANDDITEGSDRAAPGGSHDMPRTPMGGTSRRGQDPAPPAAAPKYPLPTPGYDPGGYQPGPYQQPPQTPGYPPQSPGYQQPPASGYSPPPPSYPPPASPGCPQGGPSGLDPRP